MSHMPRAHDRYSIVAIVLHWTIAALLIGMFPLGWWMTDAINQPDSQAAAFEAYQLHKSIGLTILALTVVRLVWRLTHRAPPLPAHMPAWERWGARASHVLLYAIMLLIPLTGWIYVSAGWNSAMNAPFAIPTIWFGQFEWPHIGPIAHLGDTARAAAADASMQAHTLIGYGAILLIAVHVAAALKHHLFDRDAVMAGMVPFLRPRSPLTDRKPHA